jgi:hypothetical protein
MTASGQIPAYGKGALPPNMQEAEGFLDEAGGGVVQLLHAVDP